MYIRFKNHKIIYFVTIFINLIGCQLQDPSNNHGILFLENRSAKILIGKTNKNDTIQIIGHPHTKSIDKSDDWIYIERVLTKGSFHKLGQNVLKDNNVLVLTFDKFGVVKEKRFLSKKDIKKLAFSKNITENNLSKKSFVEKFLNSIKSKMYSNQKK